LWSGFGFAYDSLRKRLVIFGGSEYSRALRNDTWEWSGSEWKQSFPAHSPPARGYCSLVFRSATGRTLLFGGVRTAAPTLQWFADTWEWDGTDWTQLFPPNSPPPRSETALAYDEGRDRVVLFGGSPNGAQETWEWDGQTWVQLFPVHSPPARWNCAMVYDPK